jgi:hypothetical protein
MHLWAQLVYVVARKPAQHAAKAMLPRARPIASPLCMGFDIETCHWTKIDTRGIAFVSESGLTYTETTIFSGLNEFAMISHAGMPQCENAAHQIGLTVDAHLLVHILRMRAHCFR